MGSGREEAGPRSICARRPVLDRPWGHQGTCGCHIIPPRDLPGLLHFHILDRSHADFPQFEGIIAVEKRLSLVVEYLKRMQNVVKKIKSGTLRFGTCQFRADPAQTLARTSYLRRPTTSSPATPAAWQELEKECCPNSSRGSKTTLCQSSGLQAWRARGRRPSQSRSAACCARIPQCI